MRDFIFDQRATLAKCHATTMFAACDKQSVHPNFVRFCGVGDTFMGRTSMLMLHVWMVHRVLKENPGDEEKFKKLTFFLYETIWMTLEERMMEEESISHWVVSKYLTQVQQVCIGALMSYDKSMQLFESSDDGDPLLGAVWRNVYEGNLDMNKAHLVQLRNYMLSEMERLRALPFEELHSGQLEWSTPPVSLPTPKEAEEGLSLSESYASHKMFDGEVRMTWATW